MMKQVIFIFTIDSELIQLERILFHLKILLLLMKIRDIVFPFYLFKHSRRWPRYFPTICLVILSSFLCHVHHTVLGFSFENIDLDKARIFESRQSIED